MSEEMTSLAGGPHTMRTTVRRPLAATLVGWAFILMGGYYGMVMLGEWLQGRLSLDLGALMVPVGVGLRQGRSSSQSWARLIAGLWIVVGSVMLLSLGWDVRHADPSLFESTPLGWPSWVATLINSLLALVSGSVVWWAVSDRAYVAHLVTKGPVPADR